MSHFAKVTDGKVIQVIVAEPEFFESFIDSSPGAWLQTSYNTFANKHTQGGTPLRGNYAGLGFTYDAVEDVFYAPQPYPSWLLNKDTWVWESPVTMPIEDGEVYIWDESTTVWTKVISKEVAP